jgi:hypothetical protein
VASGSTPGGYLNRGDGTGEPPAGILRPGNAGSNTTADHQEVVDLALAQLPVASRDQPGLVPRHRAIDPDGQPRPGVEVAELQTLELAGWPDGTRAICRRKDHISAPSFVHRRRRHRFQVFITDQPDPDVARLELRHRQRADVEDRIRAAKATGAARPAI